MGNRDETIEIREGDYVIAGVVAAAPPHASARLAGLRTPILIAFALGFVATAVVGIIANLI